MTLNVASINVSVSAEVFKQQAMNVFDAVSFEDMAACMKSTYVPVRNESKYVSIKMHVNM